MYSWLLFMLTLNFGLFVLSTGCEAGTYGQNCENICRGHCLECHVDTGNCLQYNGQTCFYCSSNNCDNRGICKTCLNGRHGRYCNLTCPNNCAECTSSSNCTRCIDGYYGSKCFEKCPIHCTSCLNGNNMQFMWKLNGPVKLANAIVTAVIIAERQANAQKDV